MDYRGYVDMGLGIVNPDGAALNSHWWWAEKGTTVQLDFTYPMTSLLEKSLNFYLQIQYFSGYATKRCFTITTAMTLLGLDFPSSGKRSKNGSLSALVRKYSDVPRFMLI